MRLWHKDLITVLPDKQLTGQWRECICMAVNIYTKGDTGNFLTDKIMHYPMSHFISYCNLVRDEMVIRKYNLTSMSLGKLQKLCDYGNPSIPIEYNLLFDDWHNERYLKQCFFNLQEKYDCGGFSYEVYFNIVNQCRRCGLSIEEYLD